MVDEMWIDEYYTDENMGKSFKVIPQNDIVKPIRVVRYDILVMRLKKLMSYFEESQSLLNDLKEDLGKIDWEGTSFLLISILTLVLGMFQSQNLATCYETYTYQVWVCDVSIFFFMFISCLTLWGLFLLYNLISLCCIKWN